MNPRALRVLVVDDDEDDFVLIRDMLGELGDRDYSLDWCATPEDGLAQLRRGGHDVYLVDYLLGTGSGLELIETVSREGLSRAFIILTGRGNHEVDVAALAAGASDYLVKGLIDAERLDRSIRYAVDHARFIEVLRDSEMRHRLLFEQSPVPLVVFDVRSLDILTVNEAAHRQYGVAHAGKVRQSIETLFASAMERKRFLEQLRSDNLATGAVQRWELRRADKQPVQVEAIFHPLRYHGAHAVLAHLQDVTVRVQAEAKLHLFERAIESIGNGVLIAEVGKPDMPLTFINRAFERMTGYTSTEVLGRNCRFLQGAEANDSARVDIRHALQHQQEYHGLLRNIRKDGTMFWNQLYLAPVNDAEGAVTHYLGIINDVTERRDTDARLAYAAMHDEITGLARFPLIEVMLQEHAEKRTGQPFSLIFADIDRFHATNEAMGKAVGDQVIIELAARISAEVGSLGRAARFVGDEFAVAMPGVTAEAAMAVAERIRIAVARPMLLSSCEVRVTISIGVASYPQRVDDLNDLLRRAEASMSRAKQLGRDMVYLYSEQDMLRIEDRRMLGVRLRAAMRQGEFHVEYQPQISADNRAVIGFEALLRWQSPQLGLVSPERFIPVAEGLGLMSELGGWVLDRACAQSKSWMEAGLGEFFIAVNVSTQQLQRGNFCEMVVETLRRHDLPANRLELELTESALMENMEHGLLSIDRLAEFGVKLALDDFGTGYSSLSYLRQMKVDKLKIDKSFVNDLPDDADSVALAKTFVAIGHQLQMQVVAEGIETEPQSNLLGQIGCDALQGYFISYPMRAQAVPAWLKAYRAGL